MIKHTWILQILVLESHSISKYSGIMHKMCNSSGEGNLLKIIYSYIERCDTELKRLKIYFFHLQTCSLRQRTDMTDVVRVRYEQGLFLPSRVHSPT